MQTSLFFWFSRSPKRAYARLGPGIGAFLLLVALAASGCRAETSDVEEKAETRTAVRVATAEERPMRETVDYVGTVAARRTVRVSARLPGTLEELAVEEGDRVEQGDLLARIDAPELEANQERVGAKVRRAKAQEEFACEIYQTDQDLHESGALPASKLDESRNRCTSAKEGVAAARASRREGETRLEKRVERAPADGLVLERRAEPGEHVGPGSPLVVLAVHGREVVVPVVESDLARGIGIGVPTRLKLDGERTVESAVRGVGSRAEGPGRAVDVHIPLDDHFDSPTVGRSVDVTFVIDEEQGATAVPREALVRTQEGWSIYVVEEGRARRRSVERGIAEGNRIAVHPKLEPEERVVVTNLDVVRDGTPLYAVDATGGAR